MHSVNIIHEYKSIYKNSFIFLSPVGEYGAVNQSNWFLLFFLFIVRAIFVSLFCVLISKSVKTLFHSKKKQKLISEWNTFILNELKYNN